MSKNRGLTKAERWSQLMRHLDQVGPSYPAKPSEDFACKWVDIALIEVTRKNARLATIVELYYGLGRCPEPRTIPITAQAIGLSTRWTSLSRDEGVSLLKQELVRLRVATTNPPDTGSLGLLLQEMFAEDCVLKTLRSAYHLNEYGVAEARRYARRLQKHLIPALVEKLGRAPRGSDLRALSPEQVRPLAEFSEKSINWLEDYIRLFGIVLPHTKSVHGMRPEAREVLVSMGVI